MLTRSFRGSIHLTRFSKTKKSGSGFETLESGGGVDGKRKEDTSGSGAGASSALLDKERALKVSWERIGEGYAVGEAQRKCFEKFGGVEDVFIRSTKRRYSALIVMATKDEVVAATRTFCGDFSNPLLVVPLQRAQTDFVTGKKSTEAEPQSNIVGIGYQAYENQVMERLKKAGMKQKR